MIESSYWKAVQVISCTRFTLRNFGLLHFVSRRMTRLCVHSSDFEDLGKAEIIITVISASHTRRRFAIVLTLSSSS